MTTNTMTFPSEREIYVERTFDAPREKVFKACTDPELIPQWWGPRKYVTTVDKLDVRVGGAWRFISRGADGTEHAFNGVFREVLPPERLSQTFEYEGVPGHVSIETMTFEEHDGKTTLAMTALFDSVEDRDGMVNSGMEEGMNESHNRLAELLAKI